MSNILGRLLVELGVNTSSFLTGMNAASKEAKKTGQDIEHAFDHVGDALGKALGSFGEVGSKVSEIGNAINESFGAVGASGSGLGAAIGLIAGVGVAAVGAAAGLSALAVEGAEVVERFALISQKTGIGIRDLQTFEAAGKTVGVSLEDMVTAMRKFDTAIIGTGKNAGTTARLLKELGITSHDNNEALLQAADAFKNMADGPEKAADAVALFGKAGLNMIPFLNKGRAGVEEFNKIVTEFGPNITKNGIEANEDWKVSTVKLSLAWESFAVAMESEVLPVLSKLVSVMASMVHGTGDFVSGAIAGAHKLGGAAVAFTGAIMNPATSGNAFSIASQRVAEIDEQEHGGSDAVDSKRKLTEEEQRFIATQRESYEIEKAGGQAAYALLQARERVTNEVAKEHYQLATHILSDEIPALERAVALEKQRAAEAERLANTHAALEKIFQNGGTRPLPKFNEPRKGSSGGLFTLPEENPAPNINGLPEGISATAPLVKPQMFATANNEAQAFLEQYLKEVSSTVDNVNADYDRQLDHWKFLLSEQAVTQEQFNAISTAIEKRRLAGLVEARKIDGTSTFGDAWDAVFKHIEDGGRDMARSIAVDVTNAIDGLNHELASLATGGTANLKQLAQAFEQSVFESGLKKLESAGASALGLEKFGIGGSDKPKGNSSDPVFVQVVGGNGLLGGGESGGGLSGLADLFGHSDSSNSDSEGGGGFLSGLASTLFGGFRADGGDVAAGKAYVVGEKHPEIFVPGKSGTVIPSVPTGQGHVTHMEVHFHGVADADSFRKSQNQILSDIHRQASIAYSRAGGS